MFEVMLCIEVEYILIQLAQTLKRNEKPVPEKWLDKFM